MTSSTDAAARHAITERSLVKPARTLLRVPPLAEPPVRLFLTSMAVLFVELLLIRWIPAYAVFVGFFSNFILMSSFLGIGIGIMLGPRIERLPVSPFWFLLFATVVIVLGGQLNLKVASPEEIFFGLDASVSSDLNFLVLPVVALLTVGVMASLAAPLGPLFRAMPPLRAYTIDIAGSLAGILAFTVLSASGTDPLLWFGVAGALAGLLALGRGVNSWAGVPIATSVAIGVLLVAQGLTSGDFWSPYYRVTTFDDLARPAFATPAEDRLPPRYVFVSGIPHQQMDSVELALDNPLYGQIYRWFPERRFEKVLVIGAGSGTDVALALARGSREVDAVEIDRVMADIGRRYHVNRPYDDPRVTSIIEDGRAYLARTTERYDLIVFALTDSLTLVTGTANVRLESFLFTEQSMALARDHLTDDGVFVMYNIYRQSWLVTKLADMVGGTFGHQPWLRLDGPVDAVIAAGPAVAATGTPPGDTVDPVPNDGGPAPRHATDDWPFLYLRSEAIPGYYLAGLVFLVLIGMGALFLAGRGGGALRAFSPHFFALGAAFLLLETRSLVSFSLLFGSTWLVNALAFGAILTSVLLSIGVTARLPRLPRRPLYALLAGTIVIAYLLPPDRLLIDPPGLRYVLAAVIAFAPVFVANLVFTRSFADSERPDIAFASNLLGAMVGGALEYLSLLTGFRTLGLIALGLYLLAWLFVSRFRVLGDRAVARSPVFGRT